jgi:methionine biosynthesis protein MetW
MNTNHSGPDIALESVFRERPEFRQIIDVVEHGSSVLDLGCGEGKLLRALQVIKHARVQGIEVSDTAIQECVAKGLFVYHGDLNEGLADFNDKSVDYVILTNVIQVLHRPDYLIGEAARVGKNCIISIPNFGHWRVRLQLALCGSMPKTRSLPYEWYDSPNIHLTTIHDFKTFCDSHGLEVVRMTGFILGEGKCKRVSMNPNFFADYAIFVIRKP